MIIDGRKIASDITNKLTGEVASLSFEPILVDILVGDDPVSMSYVKIKKRVSERVGLEFRLEHLINIDQSGLEEAIKKISAETRMCGLILQLPLPQGFNSQAACDLIPEIIDVDLLNKRSQVKFYNNEISLIPPTAGAVLEVLDSINLDLRTKNILVVGQGSLVGKPVTHLLRNRGLEVYTADRRTTNIGELMGVADVIISGTGKAHLIKADMVKEGVVIIDAGTAESSGEIVGDVDFENVSLKAAHISPVPGGVGPVTVAKLIENVITVAKQKSN